MTGFSDTHPIWSGADKGRDSFEYKATMFIWKMFGLCVLIVFIIICILFIMMILA